METTERNYIPLPGKSYYGWSIGDKINMLKILKFYYVQKTTSKVYYAKCKCECGVIKIIGCSSIKGGQKSCGHIRTKHGKEGTQIYKIFKGMKSRCYTKSASGYEHYGARGIIICNEWLDDFMSFYNWAIENGWKNDQNLSVERKKVDGNYCPENCEIIPRKDQPGNTRATRWLTLNGETKNLMNWSKDPRAKVSYQVIRQRLTRGWDLERALTEPLREDRSHKKSKN